MDQHHLSPRSITLEAPWRAARSLAKLRRPSWFDRTKACWALIPTRKLVVFVHGFGGDALGTWRQFSDLWPPGDAGYDLVFYGYDSLRQQVIYSGSELREFLETFLAAPADMINPTVEHLTAINPGILRRAFTYQKVVFVAHSLGAIIIREALVEAEQNHPPWMTGSELVLFAPAHKGAFATKVALAGLTGVPFAHAIVSLVTLKVRALADLDEKSLEPLEKRTLDAINARGARALEPLRASTVVFPMYDSVVEQKPFGRDAGAKTFPGCGHSDVCKPRPDFTDPIDVVEPLL